MGNCCKVKASKSRTLTQIQIQIEGRSVWVRFVPDKPVSDLLEQLDASASSCSLCKGADQLLDPTATLRQLGISCSDTLTLVRRSEENVVPSMDIIAEEDSPNPQELQRLQPRILQKLRTGRVAPRTLWESAHSPTNNRHIVLERSDLSSLTNKTIDGSLKDCQPLNGLPFFIQVEPVSEDSQVRDNEQPGLCFELFTELKGLYST